MKTFLKILAWCIGVALVGVIVFFAIQSRDYVKKYVDVQQQKLELRDPKAVDSLLNVIDTYDNINKQYQSQLAATDSVISYTKTEYQRKLDSVIDFYVTDRNKLLNVINHQNQMIDKLNTMLGDEAYD